MSTPESRTDVYNKYWLALGAFIHRFAQLEKMMQLLLWEHAKVSPEIARSIFSGVKIEVARQHIERIRQSLGMPDNSDLKEALEQLATINTARNLIVHYGAEFVEGEMVSSNAYAIHIRSKPKTWPVSANVLEDMTFDLGTIQAKILCYKLANFPPFYPPHVITRQPGSPGVLARAPWRYKSPQPKQYQPSTENKTPKRPRQPKPSPS